MCEIHKEQYISSYACSMPKEETELPAAENHADEHSPSLNDINFTENDLIIAIKENQTNSSTGRMEYLQYSSRKWERASVND